MVHSWILNGLSQELSVALLYSNNAAYYEKTKKKIPSGQWALGLPTTSKERILSAHTIAS